MLPVPTGTYPGGILGPIVGSPRGVPIPSRGSSITRAGSLPAARVADQQAGNPACGALENLQPKFELATVAGVRMSSPSGLTPFTTQFTRSVNAASSSAATNPQ